MNITTYSNYPGPGWTARDDDRCDVDSEDGREFMTGSFATGENEADAIRNLMDVVEKEVCKKCGEIFCEAHK